MNRLLLILYVKLTICLLFAVAQDQLEGFLSSKLIKESYFLTTTPPNPKFATSTTEKSILLTNKNKRMARRKVIEDIYGTPPPSLENNGSPAPIVIPQHILNTVFGPKFETPQSKTSIAKEPPDLQNSTNKDTSDLEERFMSAGWLKFLYHGPQNNVTDNQVSENRTENRQGLIPKRPTTLGVQNDTNSVPESKNAANFNFIPSLIILIGCLIALNVF